jgi:hypothetical protein
MNLKNLIGGFGVYFVLVLIVSAIVSYLYSLIAHGQGVFDWDSSFQLAIIMGVALPLVHELGKKWK